jgi:hypothetical protein
VIAAMSAVDPWLDGFLCLLPWKRLGLLDWWGMGRVRERWGRGYVDRLTGGTPHK